MAVTKFPFQHFRCTVWQGQLAHATMTNDPAVIPVFPYPYIGTVDRVDEGKYGFSKKNHYYHNHLLTFDLGVFIWYVSVL